MNMSERVNVKRFIKWFDRLVNATFEGNAKLESGGERPTLH